MLNGLEGKRVIITAGGAGIGKAVAEAFLAASARVHICDVDDAALAAFTAPALGRTRTDVADPAQVDRLFEEAVAHLGGGLDVLVNCAGIAGPTGPIEAVEPKDWERCIAVNLHGSYLCSRRAVPLLKDAGGGSVVNFASSAGIMGYPLRTPYAAAKWAVVGLTKSLAMEVGPSSIRVNAICPGAVEGERMDRVIEAEARARGIGADEIRASYKKQNSLRTFISPHEIANMVLFICSDAGAKISGQTLSVDGYTETLAN